MLDQKDGQTVDVGDEHDSVEDVVVVVAEVEVEINVLEEVTSMAELDV